MLGLVCGSFLRLSVFAWDLLRVVVFGFFLLYFGFACISGLRFWGCFHEFWVGFFFFFFLFVCSLGFMGVSSGFWVFGGFGYCLCVGLCGFSSVG
jgi:hypothetical protein